VLPDRDEVDAVTPALPGDGFLDLSARASSPATAPTANASAFSPSSAAGE